jgi:hypothetical protein
VAANSHGIPDFPAGFYHPVATEAAKNKIRPIIVQTLMDCRSDLKKVISWPEPAADNDPLWQSFKFESRVSNRQLIEWADHCENGQQRDRLKHERRTKKPGDTTKASSVSRCLPHSSLFPLSQHSARLSPNCLHLKLFT